MLKSGERSQTRESHGADVIIAIKANDEHILKMLYTENYLKIEQLVLKNNGSKEQAKDLYQEAFLAFWRNIRNDKFIPSSPSSINGYLYTIAKNKWMDHLRSTRHHTPLNNHPLPEEFTLNEETYDDKIKKERLLGKVMTAFKSLGQPCKQLLTRFYFEKKSMKIIAEELQLAPASARNKKYRCMQKLREIALKGEN